MNASLSIGTEKQLSEGWNGSQMVGLSNEINAVVGKLTVRGRRYTRKFARRT